MNELQLPRVALATDGRSKEDILVLLALLLAFKKRQLAVRVVLLGSNLNLALMLKRATGRNVIIVDTNNLTQDQILKDIIRSGLSSDILIFFSDRGFFDGSSSVSTRGSLAELCELTATPAIYLTPADSFGINTKSEFFRGLLASHQSIDFVGMIYHTYEDLSFNNQQLAIINKNFSQNFLGLAKLEKNLVLDLSWGSNQIKNDTLIEHNLINKLAQTASALTCLDKIIEIGRQAPNAVPDFPALSSARRARIAMAEDLCFGISYQTNADLLRFFGAEVLPFSVMSDENLPSDIGGIYLPGAFIDSYAEDVFINQKIMREIRSFVQSGGALFSEGLGTAFLFSKIIDSKGNEHSGAGVYQSSITLKNESTSKPGKLEVMEDCVIGASGALIAGLIFDCVKINETEVLYKTAKILSAEKETMEGYSATGQSFSTFSLLNFASNPNAAKNLVDAAEVFASRKK